MSGELRSLQACRALQLQQMAVKSSITTGAKLMLPGA